MHARVEKNMSERLATKLDTELIRQMYEDGATQTEIGERLGVSQKVIWRHMKNHGIKARVAAKRNQYGPNNDSWKGGRIITDNGYIAIKTPSHPRAKNCGDYVYEHILVMEKHIGRKLKWCGRGHPDTEIVHHINGDKQDNRIENLMIVNFAEHMKIHRASQVQKVGDVNVQQSTIR
jgi:hypothetical protein